MSWFKKRNPASDTATPAAPKNPDNIFIFRLVAVGYVLYMVWQCVQAYLKGGEGAPSLPAVIISCVVLGGGGILLGILSYRNWKTDRAAYKEYLDAETAADNETPEDSWSDEDWDVDPDEIAAEDTPEESL